VRSGYGAAHVWDNYEGWDSGMMGWIDYEDEDDDEEEQCRSSGAWRPWAALTTNIALLMEFIARRTCKACGCFKELRCAQRLQPSHRIGVDLGGGAARPPAG